MTAIHRRPVLLVVVAAGALAPAVGAVAAPAAPATISVDKACYVNSATPAQVTVAGHGFAPGDQVKVSGTGFSATAVAAADGSIAATAAAPVYSSGPVSRTYNLTAVDETQPGVTAQTAIRVTNLSVAVSRTKVKNVRKDKVLFSFSGFLPGKHIYAFYIHGKAVARAVFAKAQGPCGMLHERALLYPGGRPGHNLYKVVFENTSRYSATAFPASPGSCSCTTSDGCGRAPTRPNCHDAADALPEGPPARRPGVSRR